MQNRRWIRMLCAVALVALVASDAHATLIGQSVSVALTDGGSLDASDVVVVGAGTEIAPGDGSAVSAMLLPNESVDLGAFTIEVALEEGAANGTTGYPSGTRYRFSNLSFSDPSLFISGVSLALVNVSADALGAAPSADGRRHPFSLVFRGPHAHALPQRIHRLENARLGVLEIFLVPIEPDATGRRYEAVFA